MAGWRDTVEQVLELEPEHLSCYGLKVEPGTPLDDRVVRGEKLPDDDQQADMYLWTVERLAAAGYRQYEISNFARAGFQSRHNLKYWMGRPTSASGRGPTPTSAGGATLLSGIWRAILPPCWRGAPSSTSPT